MSSDSISPKDENIIKNSLGTDSSKETNQTHTMRVCGVVVTVPNLEELIA